MKNELSIPHYGNFYFLRAKRGARGTGGRENLPVFANIVCGRCGVGWMGWNFFFLFICFNSAPEIPIKKASENLSLSISMWPMSSPFSLFGWGLDCERFMKLRWYYLNKFSWNGRSAEKKKRRRRTEKFKSALKTWSSTSFLFVATSSGNLKCFHSYWHEETIFSLFQAKTFFAICWLGAIFTMIASHFRAYSTISISIRKKLFCLRFHSASRFTVEKLRLRPLSL